MTTTERQPEPPPTQRTISEVPEPAEPATAAANSPACRDGEPLANVDDAADLQVVDECRTVSGTVTDVARDGDGYQISLRPDDSSLVTEANTDGLLLVVMVAADRADCAELTTGACTGAELTPPVAGEHVYLTGPYVYDTVTGAMAIVPLWAASADDPTTTTTTTTTLRVETTPPPTTQPPPQTTAAPAPMPSPSPTTTVASSAGATAI